MSKSAAENPVVARVSELSRVESAFNSALQQHSASLNFASELEFMKGLLQSQWDLINCTPISIRDAFMQIPSIGLSLNPTMQHATILARSMKVGGKWEKIASPMVMYRGLLHLVYRSGIVKSITVENVYDKDSVFEIEQGTSPRVKHSVNHRMPRNTEDGYLGTYVVAYPVNAQHPIIEWVPAEDMFEIRENSDAYYDKQGNVRDASPWAKWFGEQCKKSALKRAIKRWPIVLDNPEATTLGRAVWLDNKVEGAKLREGATDAEIVAEGKGAPQGEPTSLVTDEQVAKLRELCLAAKMPESEVAAAYGRDTLETMAADDFAGAIERLQKRAEVIAEKAKEKAARPARKKGAAK